VREHVAYHCNRTDIGGNQALRIRGFKQFGKHCGSHGLSRARRAPRELMANAKPQRQLKARESLAGGER
jgi:hypothetical protein